ncbi:DUF6516 family protein [Sphingoaurantiacus capsulatus]|uniref:DUF6516 family protein n=1 Tax=Sphingoaurantiacus capsulatus TaxID=1771310 RepID=A0ABV7X7N8_9SPHN
MDAERDPSLDTLLLLDGETFVIDPAGHYWVKFEAIRCEVTATRPHGLRYSLTLHDRANKRIVGFDNAHAVKAGKGPGARKPAAFDHTHRLRTIRPYDYIDAASLLTDFWKIVDAVLDERGVKR